MPKSRAERDRGRGETPSKRALRGAQKTGRQDPERGVTSRARKRRQGGEDVPDPRYGGRPGQEDSTRNWMTIAGATFAITAMGAMAYAVRRRPEAEEADWEN